MRYKADVATPNDDRVAPLLVALQNDHSDASLALLESYSTLMLKGSAARLALHYAAEHMLVEPTRRLIALGADVNATDTRGETPLHFALHCKPGKVEHDIIRLLWVPAPGSRPWEMAPRSLSRRSRGTITNR